MLPVRSMLGCLRFIDDNSLQLSVCETVLREAGFSVMSAASAERALELLRDPRMISSLRVVVTDHVLPGVNGDAFVRQLRRWKRRVPVLVVSGMPEAEPQYAGLEIKFLHKPCAPEELIRHVQAASRATIQPIPFPTMERAS
jgi:DNA-binding response OmpR family regulator